MIPVTQSWVEHIIDYNWSHVRQSIVEGEQEMADGTPMLTIDDALAQPSAPVLDEKQAHGAPERLAAPLVAAVVGGTVMQSPETREVVKQMNAALNPSGAGEGQSEPSVLTMRIGELSADRLEQAGENGHTIALTYERELVGIIIPVTQGLVEFLIEQNMSRVLYNIGMGEKELKNGDAITLAEALGEDGSPAPGAKLPSPSARGGPAFPGHRAPSA
jgi:hypothetical protein